MARPDFPSITVYTTKARKAAADKIAGESRHSLSTWVDLLIEREITQYETMLAQADSKTQVTA